MKQIDEEQEQDLDVKFYPIRNRYLERSVHGHSRLLKIILFLCAIIVFVVVADFSGYVFNDIKNLFSSAGISQLATAEENEFFVSSQPTGGPSMYAGHSIAAGSVGQLHSRKSLQNMLLQAAPDSQTTQVGYFGIDVSHWQNSIDWNQVASDTIPKKIDFSIVKATQGSDQTDPNYAENWKHSNNNFELSGAYHYYIYTDNPQAQAQNFIKNVSLQQGNFPPIVDVELNCSTCDSLSVSAEQLIHDLDIYLKEIVSHFNLKPIIYTNPDFYDKYLTGNFEEYPFWMASYEKKPPLGLVGFHSEEADSTSNPMVVLWQFTDYERVMGIIGKVDMNFLPEEAMNSIRFAGNE